MCVVLLVRNLGLCGRLFWLILLADFFSMSHIFILANIQFSLPLFAAAVLTNIKQGLFVFVFCLGKNCVSVV